MVDMVDFLSTSLRVTTPILLSALGALIASSAGATNIALEGIMLFSAFVGAVVSGLTQSLLFSLLSAVSSGLIMTGILAFFSLKLKASIIMAAIALNIFSSGGTIFFLSVITGEKGSSASIESLVFPTLEIPLFKTIPWIGEIISGHNVLTYFALFSVFAVSYMLKRTPLGTKIRAVGENREAAESVGISVKRVKTIALLLSGFYASLGGVYLSMGYVSWFSRNMTSGRGWIALAAQALGGKSAYGVAISSGVFGMSESASYSLKLLNIPGELTQAFPFIITVLVLIIVSFKKKRQFIGNS